MGPGALVAATFIGSGDVATGGTAGGFYGLGYWWAYWVTCAVAWFCLDVVGRYYIVTGKQGLSMFRELPVIGPFLGLFLAVFGVYYGVGNVNSQFASTAWALQGLFPTISFEIAAAVAAVACMGLVWMGNYGWLEKLMSVLLVAIVGSFFAALIATGVNWGDAARGLLPIGGPPGTVLLDLPGHRRHQHQRRRRAPLRLQLGREGQLARQAGGQGPLPDLRPRQRPTGLLRGRAGRLRHPGDHQPGDLPLRHRPPQGGGLRRPDRAGRRHLVHLHLQPGCSGRGILQRHRQRHGGRLC